MNQKAKSWLGCERLQLRIFSWFVLFEAIVLYQCLLHSMILMRSTEHR